MTRRTVLLIAMGLAVLLTGCTGDDSDAQATSTSQVVPSSTSTSSPPTTAAVPSTTTAAPDSDGDEWVVIGDLDSTVAFVNPDGFTAVDLTAGDIEDIFNQLEEEGVLLNGEMRTLVDRAIASQSVDFVYWAFDFGSASPDFLPNVNIIKSPAGPFDRAEVYLEVLPAQLELIGLKVVSIDEFETPAEPAVMIVSTPPEDWIEYVTVQLIAPGDDWVYTVSFSFEDEESVDMDLVIKTFTSLTPS